MRDRLGIEDADVGDRTGLQRSAVLKAELTRRRRRGLPDRFLPRDDAALAHEPPEEFGEASPGPRVLHAQRRTVVRADPDQRIAHDRHDIVVVHPVLHDHGTGILRDERADRGERIERSRVSDVGDRATDRRGVGVRDDHGVLRGRRPPAARRQLPTERLRVGTSRLELLDASFRRLRWEQRDEERRARGVRVLIPAHIDAFGSGTVEGVEQQGALPLVLGAERLAVRDLHPGTGATADLERLLERLAEPFAFVPHVGRVRTSPPGRDPGDRHDLIGVRVRRRNVDQPGGQAHGARAERLFRQRAHRGERIVREIAARAVRGEAERPVADQRRDVVRRAGGFDAIEVVGERAGEGRHTGQQVPPGIVDVAGRYLVQRRHREPTVADDLGRDPLEQLERLRFRHQWQRVRVRVRVDEPGSDEPPLGGDRPPCGSHVASPPRRRAPPRSRHPPARRESPARRGRLLR